MKKHLIIFFILFNSCSENLTETLDPIYKIPDNPISVLVIDDISQVNDNEKLLIQNFFDINLFEDEIIRAKKKLIYSKHKVGKDDVGKIILTEKSDEILNINVTDSINYDKKTIFIFEHNDDKYFLKKDLDYNVISNNKFLIENYTRNSSFSSNSNSKNFFDLFKIKSNNICVLISENFNSNKLNKLNIKVDEISDWINFEFEIKNNEIVIMGLSKIDKKSRNSLIFNKIKPSKSEIYKLIPENFVKFKSYTVNEQFFMNFSEIINQNTTMQFNIDSVFTTSSEVAIFNSVTDTIIILNNKLYDIEKNNILNFEKKYRDFKIYKNDSITTRINEFDEFNFLNKNIFISQIDNRILISNKVNSIEKLIAGNYNKSELLYNKELKEYIKNVPSKNSVIELIKIKKSKEIYDLWIKSSQIQDSIIYTSLYNSPIINDFKKNQTELILTKSFENDIKLGPQIIMNHKSGKKNIIVQDEKNHLILMDFLGNILWTKKFNNITSKIFQVDTYKNQRLQFLFTTSNELILLDINGNIVKKLEGKNKDYFENLSVFDYDLDKNYRYIFQNGNNLKMYNSDFKIVKGFKKNKLNYGLKDPVKHLRILNRDYLILKNSNDKISVLDRRGNVRIKVPDDLTFSTNLFKYNNGMIGLTNDEKIIRIDISGKLYDQTLSKNEKDLSAVNNSKITFGLNKLLVDGKEFILPFGNYDNLKIHGSQETHFYSIYDKDSKQIYLYDNQKIVNGFPIFSNSDIDFNSENNKIDIVFLGDYNEIQLYSIK
ncbi:MAG: hypothetical protein VXX96_02565 [Bacteroidota bacterium]|nr:hypothetical protein [Bacteroidota bacterium]